MPLDRFIKKNPPSGNQSLQCEVIGLEELRKLQQQHRLLIPKVMHLNSEELCIEKVTVCSPDKPHWIKLGNGLAKLHRASAQKDFGFAKDNFIGLNPQPNVWLQNWGKFFVEYRLEFQVSLIKDGSLRAELTSLLNQYRGPLVDFLNAHNPAASLVHGDLWSGNVLFSEAGPWLIDPAAHYADREVDLAMTRIFGGFTPEFYSAYTAEWPLPSGHELRCRIYNLYHYLNHCNLFGDSYLAGVRDGFDAIRSLI